MSQNMSVYDVRHKFRLHHCSGLVISRAPLPEERVYLIDEDNTRLRLPR